MSGRCAARLSSRYALLVTNAAAHQPCGRTSRTQIGCTRFALQGSNPKSAPIRLTHESAWWVWWGHQDERRCATRLFGRDSVRTQPCGCKVRIFGEGVAVGSS